MDEMTFTSVQYYKDPISDTNAGYKVVTGDGDTLFVILNSTGNRHYDEIQRQVAAGTLTIQDAD
jgi:hypothetical protein